MKVFNLSCLLLIGVLPLSYGQSSRSIKFEEVQEVGSSQYINVEEPKQSLKMESGLVLQIELMDASDDNEIFYNNSEFSGRYNYQYYQMNIEDYWLGKKNRERIKKKPDEQFLMEGIYYLFDNDEISEEIYDQFMEELIPTSVKDSLNFFTPDNKQNFNPFHIHSPNKIRQNNYLNLLKVKIKNETNQPIVNDLNFHVFNGGESLEALTSGQIMGFYSNWENVRVKIQNLERSNILNQKIFPANTTSVGYIATLPMNLRDEEVSVAVSDKNSTSSLTWQAEIKKEGFSSTIKFYEVKVRPAVYSYKSIYVIESETPQMYITDGNLYVKEADLDEELVIHYIGIKKNSLYQGKTLPMKISEFLDFQRMRRDRVRIPASYMSDVKRFEKGD